MHSISVGYSRQRATSNPASVGGSNFIPHQPSYRIAITGTGARHSLKYGTGAEVRRCCLVKKRLHAADPVQLVWNGPCGKIFENGAVYSLRYAMADWPESLWWLEDVGKMYLMEFKDAANNGFRCGIWNINHGGMVSLIELGFYCWWHIHNILLVAIKLRLNVSEKSFEQNIIKLSINLWKNWLTLE